MDDLSAPLFPLLRVFTRKPHGVQREKPYLAWVSLTSTIRWIVYRKPLEKQLEFTTFRHSYCLTLERLAHTAQWEQVTEAVYTEEHEAGHALVVRGALSKPKTNPLSSNIELILIFEQSNRDEVEAWLSLLRIRIAPWQLLANLMMQLKHTPPEGFQLDALRKELLNLSSADHLEALLPSTTEEPPRKRLRGLSKAEKMVEDGRIFADCIKHLMDFGNTISTIVKRAAPAAASGAQHAADITKSVAVVSSVFQVVAFGVKIALMFDEARRGREQYPVLGNLLARLQRELSKSIHVFLSCSTRVGALQIENIFKVQHETLTLMGSIEDEFMRSNLSRFLKADNLKDVEESVRKVEQAVLVISNARESVETRKVLDDVITDIAVLKDAALNSTDTFKANFDSPLLQSRVVFDFESCDGVTGARTTSEGRLLDAVLRPAGADGSLGASALGTHGMGGVGKTTALKQLCHHELVRAMFTDGVFFLEFGQGADDAKVIGELMRFVCNSGGKNTAEKMREMRRDGKLGDVVDRAAEWVKGRTVLLVCDDLWGTNNTKFGYVHQLRRVLRNAPHSRLLVSTRCRSIARAVSSSPVSFDVLDVQGDKAREIVGKAAFGDNWRRRLRLFTCETHLEAILHVCGGLPLALALAGSAINSLYIDSGSAEFAVRKYSSGLEKKGVQQLQKEAEAEYHPAGLKYVVQASLNASDVWGRSDGRNYDMWHLFKSLCVLEKHQLIPENVLHRYWNLQEDLVEDVVNKFADLNVIKRESFGATRSDDSSEETLQQFCVRLHDLVLDLCRQMAGDRQVVHHLRMVQAYSSTLQQLPPDESSEQQNMAWWLLCDDGYFYSNITRHLVSAGQCKQLQCLLCDCRWSLRRMKIGGWPALNQDFQQLFSSSSRTHYAAMRNLLQVLTSSWHGVSRHRSLFAFNVFGHLSQRERNAECVAEYLQSVRKYYPDPWLLPLTKCFTPRDGRQVSMWNMPMGVRSVCVSWPNQRVYIATGKDIQVWCINSQQPLRTMKGHTKEVSSLAISSDGKIIVSGSMDQTVRRWDAHTGLPVGDAMQGHTHWVSSVAISSDGKIIVSGSMDKTVRRWDAHTGLPVGDAMQGHTKEVNSVAISSDDKLIVSGSHDTTVRRWDAHTGLPVGDAMEGHDDFVNSVAISSDGKRIVSGSDDMTVRRWDAHTGLLVGIPMQGHTDWVSSVAISSDGKLIVSGSHDTTVRRWDAHTGLPVGDAMQGHTEWVKSVEMSSDGNHIVSGSMDSTVRQWDADIGLPLGDAMQGHTDWVSSVTISSDGKRIVSGSLDNTVRRWDADTGLPVGDAMKGHTNAVSSVAISSDGKEIVSGSMDSTVRRWDSRTGLPVGNAMQGHTKGVRSVAICSDEKRIVSVSFDGTVRRWDAHTGLPVGDVIEEQQGCNVLLGTNERARGEIGELAEDGVTVLPCEALCHIVTSDGRKIVLGLRNGCVIACQVQATAPTLQAGKDNAF